MSFQQRLCFALALSFGLGATVALAQQIRQPASVLPWRAPPANVGPLLEPAAPSESSDSPAWLIDCDWQPRQIQQLREGLPMVEAESFAHLGQLHPESTAVQLRSAELHRTGRSSVQSRTVNWFRSLGIQAQLPGQRR